MPSYHLIFCRPLVFLPSIFPSIRIFSNESVLHIRWPEYWSFSFNIRPSSEYSGLISFRMDWLDLLAVEGTLKSLLQHHSWKASILWCSALWSNPHIRETLAMSERESPYSVVARWCHVKMKAMCYKIFSFFLVQVRNILIGFHVKIPILLKYCSGLKQNVPVGRIWLCVTSLPLCDRWF